MMRSLLFIVLLILTTSCSNSKKNTVTDSQFHGEFLYLADAAVLNTGTEIYGVIIDEKMHELHNLCVPLKREEFDMIPVYIKGKVEKKDPNEEGWENRIRITSIDSLVNPKDMTIIKPN